MEKWAIRTGAGAIVIVFVPLLLELVEPLGFAVGVTIRDILRVHVARWSIEVAGGDNQLRFIQVRSESTSPLLRSRSRAQLSTFRACTDQTLGCPEP